MGPFFASSSFALAVLPVAFPAPLPSIAQVSLEWGLPAEPVYAGEVIPISLRITLPEEWLDENLLQLFPQPLALPLQVAGFDGLGGSRLTPLENPGETGTESLVVDGAICLATGPALSDGPDGRLATFEVRRWFQAPRAGTIALPGAGVRYAYAAEFREDFVQGRVPVDRTAADAVGQESTLEIQSLPEKGRPFEFTGLVGSYRISTQSRTSMRLDGTIPMIVRVLSPGDSPSPKIAPRDVRLTDTAAFIEVGRTSTQANGETTIDISFQPEVTGFHQLPSALVTVFDPTLDPPAYRVVSAEGPGVQVRPSEGSDSGEATRDGHGPVADVSPPLDSMEADAPKPRPYWTLGVGAFVFALAVASVVRRRLL